MKKLPGKPSKWGVIDLRELEETVDAEAREWARRRKEELLREKAAAFSPCGPPGVESRAASEDDD